MINKKISGFVKKIMLFLVLTGIISVIPSYASLEGLGGIVQVNMKDGTKYRGELMSVLGRDISIFDLLSGKGVKISIDNVKNMSIMRSQDRNYYEVNGAVAGIISGMVINSRLEEKKKLSVPLAIVGMGFGAFLKHLSHKKTIFKVQEMSASDIEGLLVELKKRTRENALSSKRTSPKGILGRFQVSWRPFFYHRVEGDNSLTGGSVVVPGDPAIGDQGGTGELDNYVNYRDEQPHLGSVRLEYAIRDNFLAGLEWVSLGSHSTGMYGDVKITANQQEYFSDIFFAGQYSANIGLVTGSYQVPVGYNKNIGIKLEAGIGASFANTNMQLNPTWGYSNDTSFNSSTAKHQINAAFLGGLCVEFFPSNTISSGIYFQYLHAPIDSPDYNDMDTVDFYLKSGYNPTKSFSRTGTFNVPSFKLNAGRFSLGYYIRFR